MYKMILTSGIDLLQKIEGIAAGDWIIGLLLALFIIIPCWLALARRKEVWMQVDAWTELAEQTGLTYKPAQSPFRWWWGKFMDPPALRGEYRGRYVSFALMTVSDSDKFIDPVFQNVLISLHVRNDARFSLSIHGHVFRRLKLYGGNENFDSLYGIDGLPHQYVQEAVRLVTHTNPSLLAWIKLNPPSIELKGESMTCLQNGQLVSVDDQLLLLNLLCDLAELAETMEFEPANEEPGSS